MVTGKRIAPFDDLHGSGYSSGSPATGLARLKPFVAAGDDPIPGRERALDRDPRAQPWPAVTGTGSTVSSSLMR